MGLTGDKNQDNQIAIGLMKIASFDCSQFQFSLKLNQFSNIGTKSNLTGGKRFKLFFSIFFGCFQLSF